MLKDGNWVKEGYQRVREAVRRVHIGYSRVYLHIISFTWVQRGAQGMENSSFTFGTFWDFFTSKYF